ncbi:MAG: glycosyltransferase involved in cell wall biosynthesis [Parvicella sp.]|jgi:glycosyltransferase involved in cell wall biosynthesis
MNVNITVFIPTKNEIIHIERSVRSALKLTPNVYVVDSASTDGTIEMAESLGVVVLQYDWTASSNFSTKFNWALENLPTKTTWIIRLDADEYFLEDTINTLSDELAKIDPSINAATLNRRIHFHGRWIKHSGQNPRPMSRVTRSGFCRYEPRWLDEHVEVDGNKIANLSLDFVDDNLMTSSQWVKKHDGYAIKEAVEMLHQEIEIFQREEMHGNIGKSAKLAKKEKSIYAQMPLYWRAFLYFFYRHFIRLGFLDGYQGFLWNFFQGWWYRALIDVKISEIKKNCGNDSSKIRAYCKKEYGIEI